jgi:hypothetical protein
MHGNETNIDQARRLPHLRGGMDHTTPRPQPQPDPDPPIIKAGGYIPTFDPQDLRGIPAIGRNVTGAIPGTNPEGVTFR